MATGCPLGAPLLIRLHDDHTAKEGCELWFNILKNKNNKNPTELYTDGLQGALQGSANQRLRAHRNSRPSPS